MDTKKLLFAGLIPVLLAGCLSPTYHKEKVFDEKLDRLTVGKVQREIKIGMPSAEVVQVLGSPNMVTTDEQRREVWVYVKVSADVSYFISGCYASLILNGTDRDSGAKTSTKRTLTIIIKFDNDGKVR